MQGIFFFLIANSVKLLVISTLKLSVSSWFSFDKLYGSRSLILEPILACPIYWHVTVYNIFTVFIPVIFKFYFIFYFFCSSDWWFLVLCLHLPGHLLILPDYLICYLLPLGHFVLAIVLSNFDWFLFITFSSLLQWSTFLCPFLMPSAFLFCLFWSQDLIDWRGLIYFSFRRFILFFSLETVLFFIFLIYLTVWI